MTHLKDTDQESDWRKFVHQHRDKAFKACLLVLAGLCIALVIVTVSFSSKSMKLAETHAVIEQDGSTLTEARHESLIEACQWVNTTIDCQNTSSIYSDVFEALLSIPHQNNLILKIENQHFPNSMLTNKWIPSKKDIKKISIKDSYFFHIRNEAFNCVDFTKTHALVLVGVNLSKLSNGVLLGLSTLHSLHVVGKIGFIHRCFFQPVQASLMRLRLSGELNISGDENVFGVSNLPLLTTMDLSDKTISGSLSRNFFAAVLNVKCVTLSNSKITSINDDAFIDIANNLEILDLSNNLLTTIDVISLEHILSLGKVSTYLLGNIWFCDCDLKPLIDLYINYERRFGDIPYCKGPPKQYGVLFTNVTFVVDCEELSVEESEMETSPPIVSTSSVAVVTPTLEVATTDAVGGESSSFQMRCLSVVSLPSDYDALSSEQMEYFLFAPPCHEFDLILLKNNSVQVIVEDADEPINIVWFSEAKENFVYTIHGITVDYNCEGYTNPHLIVDNLYENVTYTFCLVPSGTYSITPFNCLPLHVPINTRDDSIVWISADEKQFTVGIVCLIFICSMLLGGVVAYFGIKSYPDLLEGSRHVLVVKRSDQTCYVSTITEGEYMLNQKNSLNNKGSLNKIPLSWSQSTLPLPSLPSPTLNIGNDSIEEVEDHYEEPCIYNKVHHCHLQCIPNKYAMSPMSPPPLPKRNSDTGLYSLRSELLPEKSNPKMSF